VSGLPTHPIPTWICRIPANKSIDVLLGESGQRNTVLREVLAERCRVQRVIPKMSRREATRLQALKIRIDVRADWRREVSPSALLRRDECFQHLSPPCRPRTAGNAYGCWNPPAICADRKGLTPPAAQPSHTRFTYLIAQHTWGDSNLYLRRIDDRLLLSIEHRAAPSSNGLPLALSAVDDALALHVVEVTPSTPPPAPSPLQTLEHVLAHADRPLTFSELRRACRLRTARICQALAALTAQGRVHKTGVGYQLTAASDISDDPFPTTPLHSPGNGNG